MPAWCALTSVLQGIHVMLDNHGDMVGSAGCGNGVPMWLQQKAAPDLIGKQLETGFPYSLVDSIRVDKLGGYNTCKGNASKWAAYAGDPNYNLLNECCLAMNGGNPAGRCNHELLVPGLHHTCTTLLVTLRHIRAGVHNHQPKDHGLHHG